MVDNTNSLLDQIKARHGLPSDYALSNRMGLTRSMISAYRKHKRLLGDEPAIKAAYLLDLPAGYVLACISAERAQTEAARAAWVAVAEQLHPTAKPAKKGGKSGAGKECILCQIPDSDSKKPARRRARRYSPVLNA